MKTPFPAFYFQTAPHPALPQVLVRPCEVETMLPGAQKAVIRLHSLMSCGWVSRVVDFADLASTPEKAAEEAARRVKLLPLAQLSKPAPAEKSASPEKAGAGVGGPSS